MSLEQIIEIFGLIGIGGILKGIIDLFIESRRTKDKSKQILKEVRYKAIILLCYTYCNYELGGAKLALNRPDIKSIEELYEELNVEWINMTLYASDKVILAMKRFLDAKSSEEFGRLILAMRKDLYGIKTRIDYFDLNLLNK